MSIIKKLKECKDSKKEQYLKMVRQKFKLNNDERFVITKLRMLLFELNASFETFQIRKPSKHHKKGKNKKQSQGKETKIVKSKREQKPSQTIKTGTKEKKKCEKKLRVTLEERQLEKLRKQTPSINELSIRNPISKIEFLKSVNLHSRVITL